MKACGATAPGGRPPSASGSQFSKSTIDGFVTCVRQHGYNLPQPNLSGKGPVFAPSIERKPTFQAASKACQSKLVPAGGGAAPADGTSPPGA
jgi:hypothetical protein